MQAKARRFMAELFEAFLEDPLVLPEDVQAASEREGLPRAVCDDFASMTDR